MPAERNAVKLGTTLIVIFLLFFGILLWLPNSLGSGPMQTFKVRFPQEWALPTLIKDSKVLVAGRPVGKVTDIKLEEMAIDPEQASRGTDLYLVVSAKMEKAVELKKDCQIRAVGEVLGGNGTLLVDVGSSAADADLTRVLNGASPGGFNAYLDNLGRELDANNPHSMLGLIKYQLMADKQGTVMAKLQLSMDDLNAVTRSAALQLDPEQKRSLMAKLERTLDEINATTGSLRTQFDAGRPDVVMGKVHKALDTLNGGLQTAATILEENKVPINQIVKHLESTSAKLDTRVVESIADQVDTRNASGIVAKVNVAMDDLNKALKDITVVTGTTREVVVYNKDNVNTILLNFRQVSEQIKGAARYVAAHPWVIFREPSATASKQQAIFDAARSFAEAAQSLDDATSQLKSLADMNNGQIAADNPELPKIRTEIEATFAKFKQAESSLWRALDVKH